MLKNIFNNAEIAESAINGSPETWARLLAKPRTDALTDIIDIMSLRPNQRLTVSLTSSQQIGIILPLRRHDRKNVKLWKLAIAVAADSSVYFDAPSAVWGSSQLQLPEDYLRITQNLGKLHFSRYSGELIWPSFVQEASASLQSIGNSELLPFYDDLCGGFDCWSRDDLDRYMRFEHETCRVHYLLTGEFSDWLELRFNETTSSSLIGNALKRP